MDNHQEETNHAGAQSRAEGANLTDVLERLLPCPFCGSTNISAGECLSEKENGDLYTQSGCLDCGAFGPEAPITKKESLGPESDLAANAKWNMRSNGTELTGAL